VLLLCQLLDRVGRSRTVPVGAFAPLAPGIICMTSAIQKRIAGQASRSIVGKITKRVRAAIRL